MNNMMLAVDIGNTNISFGIFRRMRLVRRFDIPAKAYTPKRLRAGLGILRPDDAIICSVVPAVTTVLKRDLTRILGRKPYIIGKDVRVPIKNLYRHPGQVGQDRLVNAYAAALIYGRPSVVVDFGTAITFDIISKKGAYLGGMVLPGLSISLKTLAENTALLPNVRLQRPKEFIGRDTKNSMLSGIIFGFAALVDKISVRIKERIGKSAYVIGTGGNIGLIGPYIKSLDKADRDLTLKGLSIIYKNRVSNLRRKHHGKGK